MCVEIVFKGFALTHKSKCIFAFKSGFNRMRGYIRLSGTDGQSGVHRERFLDGH